MRKNEFHGKVTLSAGDTNGFKLRCQGYRAEAIRSLTIPFWYLPDLRLSALMVLIHSRYGFENVSDFVSLSVLSS